MFGENEQSEIATSEHDLFELDPYRENIPIVYENSQNINKEVPSKQLT